MSFTLCDFLGEGELAGLFQWFGFVILLALSYC